MGLSLVAHVNVHVIISCHTHDFQFSKVHKDAVHKLINMHVPVINLL